MDTDITQLEQSLAIERRALDRNLFELEDKARALRDWRTYFRRYPFAAIGIGLATGAVIGLVSRSRTRSGTIRTPDRNESLSDSRSGLAGLARPPAARVRHQAGQTVDHIAEALMGVVAAKAVEFVGARVTGFREEFTKRYPS